MKFIIKLLILSSFIFGIQVEAYRYGKYNRFYNYRPYNYYNSGGCSSCSAY